MMKSSLVILGGIALASALPEPQNLEKRVCPHDNLLRCLIGTPSLAIPFCSSSVGIFPTASTVIVSVTPTASVSATATLSSTSTSTSTVLSTSTSTTVSISVTTTTAALPTITVTIISKRTSTFTTVTPPPGGCPAGAFLVRRAPKTSLGCIADLKPAPTAVSSACSCFSGSYAPSIPPVTVSVLAPAATVNAGTVTTTVPVTVGAVTTVTVYTTTTSVEVVTVTEPAICTTVP